MASLKERVSGRLERLRAAHPGLDHVLRTVKHYGEVDGNAQAGAVTYFGFLSFFPILALSFVVVGVLAHVYPELKNDLKTLVNDLLPGVVGPADDGKIPLRTFEQAAGAIGLVGLAAVLYSGLGWLSGMRAALEVMFVVPRREQPGLLRGKVLDLGALAGIGTILLLSVGLSTLVVGFSSALLGLVGIDATALVPHLVLAAVAILLAVAATSLLLVTMFKLLVESHVPRKALWQGALLGAVGFEVLKAGAGLLLAQTEGQRAFQAFGVALILVIWINYFSRLVMYAAAFAYTAPEARARREAALTRAPGAALTPDLPAGQQDGAAEDTPAPDDEHEPVPAPARAAGTSYAPGHRAATGPDRSRQRALAAGAAGLVAVLLAVRSARRSDA